MAANPRYSLPAFARPLAVDHSTLSLTYRAIVVAFGSAWLELGLQGAIERLPIAALTVNR